MAGNIPMGSMSTEIKLNGSQSVKTLRELKQAVAQTTSAWKAQRAELSTIGKSTEAAEAKYKGLAETIKKQKDYISGLQEAQKHLQEAQKSVDRSTKEGRQEYGKYNEALQKNETRIHSAQQKLAGLADQQSKAKKSLDYYKSGLAEAQKQLQLNESVTKSYVARLSSEGKSYEAAKVKLNGYRNSIESLTKQQKIQEQELSRIASESGKSSEAYKRQQVRVNETAASLAKAKTQMTELDNSMRKANPSFLDRIRSKLTGVNKEANQTHKTFKEVFAGSALGNALSNAVSNVTGQLKNTVTEGMALNAAVAKINSRFKSMGMSDRYIKILDNQIGELKAQTNMTGDNVANLQAKMLNWSNIGTKGAMQMTKMIAGVGDSSKLTGDQIEQMGASLMRVGANGKVTYSALNRVTKSAPTFMAQLAKGADMSEDKLKSLLKSGKVTQTQFQEWMAAASKYSDTAFKDFGKTQGGALKYMHERWKDLEKTMAKPIFDAKTSGLQSLKDIMSSPELQKGAEAIGNALSATLGYLDKHKKDIAGVTSDITHIGVELAKDLWKDFAGIVGDIGKSFGKIGGNSKKSQDPLHAVKVTLDGLAKNKTAIQWIAKAIELIAAAKLANAANGLFHISTIAKGSADALIGLTKGFKGVDDASKLEGTQKTFYKLADFLKNSKFASLAKKAGSSIVSGFKKGATGISKATSWIGKKILSGSKSLISKAKDLGGKIGSAITKAVKASTKLSVGKRAGVGALAGAAVATPEVINAVKDRHSADKRSQDIGGAVGALAGGTLTSMIPVVGPMLAPVGAIIGKYAGRWGGQAVNNFTKGWQRNKPPKNFWSLENLGYSAHNMWNGFTKDVSNTIKWFQKNWKEVGLYFVNPLAGAINSLYKHNSGFRNWVNGLVKGFKNAWKGIGKWWSNIWKGITNNRYVKAFQKGKLFSTALKDMHKGWKQGVEQSHKVMAKFWKNTAKGWNNMWKHINSNRYVKAFRKGKLFQTALKDMRSRFNAFNKWLGKKWSSTWRGVNNNRYVKAFKKGQFFSTALKDMKSRWSSFNKWLGKNWNSFWGSTQKWAKQSWGGTVKNWNGFTKSINTGWKSFKNGFKSSWNGFWNGLGSIVKSWGKTIKDDFTGTINNIIGGFNDVVRAMGGKKKTIDFLHFSNGTDWRKKYGTPAIVNDAPGENYREGLLANGQVIPFPDKRNIPFWLLPGQDIVNGNDMAKMYGNAIHYANGTVHLSKNHKYFKKSYELAQKRAIEDKKELKKLGDKISKAIKDKDGNEARRSTQEFNKLTKKYSADKRASHKPNPHAGQVLVDQGLLIGANSRIGHSVYISKSLFKKLIADLRKKNTTHKRASHHRRTYHERETTRRRSTRRRSTSVRRSYRVSTVRARVIGLSSIRALARAINSVTGKHTATITVSYSGTYRARISIQRLLSAFRKLQRTKSASLSVKYSGTYRAAKSVERLRRSINSLRRIKTIKVRVKYSGTYKAKKSVDRLRKSINSLRKLKTIKVQVKYSGTYRAKKSIDRLTKSLRSLNKNAKKSKFGKLISEQAVEAVKSLKGKGNFAKQFASMTKRFDKDLNAMTKNSKTEFKSMWSDIEKSSDTGETHLTHQLDSFSSKYKRGWSSLEHGVDRAFSHFWTNMETAAGKGVNSVIKILNSAIGKIDSVISAFGGSKTAVHKSGYVHYAGGTDANGRLTHDTLAIVNDAKQGPRQEAIITDRNDVLIPRGKDVPVMLKKGWGVLNGTQTQQLGLPHFANGTGLKQLYELAKKNWNHPVKTGQDMFSAVTGLTGAMKDLASGMRSKSENSGVNWWSQLWKMVEDKVNDDDLGPAKGLLKAVEKLGEGKPYVTGGYGVDAKGYDCSGLVSTALEKYFNSGWGHLDVAGLWKHATRIPKSQAKPGDPVFWLPDGHVGVYAGRNKYYSAFGPDIGMHSIFGQDPGTEGPVFGRFKGINTEGPKSEDEPSVKANNRLQKLIKAQVGKGFWTTIQKIADKYGETAIGSVATPKEARQVIEKAMRIAGVSGNSWLHGLETIALHESNFRNVVNTWDSNAAAGTPSAGWFQMIEPTFRTYAKSGYEKWRSPLDQAISAIRYIQSRYHSISNVPGIASLRNGGAYQGYANGGIASTPSIFGEAGPEMAIPLVPSKSTRAWELIGKAVAVLSANSNFNNQQQVNLKEQKEEHDFRQAVLLLLSEIAGKSDVAKITLTTPAGRALWEVVEPYSKQEQRAEQIRERRGLSGRFG